MDNRCLSASTRTRPARTIEGVQLSVKYSDKVAVDMVIAGRVRSWSSYNRVWTLGEFCRQEKKRGKVSRVANRPVSQLSAKANRTLND